MLHILIDTCVWLDIAKDPRQRHLLDVLDQSIEDGEINLIVPGIVVDEIQKNKDKIIEQNKQSISSQFSIVREQVEKLGNSKIRKIVLEELGAVKQKVPTLSASTGYSISTVEALISKSTIIEITESVKLKAAERAISRKAPFHRDKNSINDAVIFEIYTSCITDERIKGDRYAFVTHNVKDFSDPEGNHKSPHPDLIEWFSKRHSNYYISLAELLRKFNPILVSESMLSRETLDNTRTLSEIEEVENHLFEKVWYDRHKLWERSIIEGHHKVVPDKQYVGYKPNVTKESTWKRAQTIASKIERKHGTNQLGPWSDFDWGMLNGKLSAIRWVLGDEWDNLDT